MNNMKIVLIGGHLSPALCVIEQLPKDANILYIGREHALEGDRVVSLEYEVIKKQGIQFVNLNSGRLQRSFSIHTIPSLIKIPLGFLKSIYILRKFKPDVVVGFGGYLSYPVIVAANLLKIPIVIHEQTFNAGISNKHVAKYADKVCISFESSRKYFPRDKVVLTGNPIRKSVLNPKKDIKFSMASPVIYITGGSIGSHTINKLVMDTLPKLLDRASVIHQTGGATKYKDFEKLQILKEGLNRNKKDKYILSKSFIPDEIGSIYNKADLVIGRAGINTISELISLQKPSILIPLPTTQKNEQQINAIYLKSLGLGEVLDQNKLDSELFINTINDMLDNLHEYKLKSNELIFSKDTSKKIVKIIYEASSKSNN